MAPVPMFRAVTVTPGMTEPLESDTVPRMLPIAPCAAGCESANATRSVVHTKNERTKRCLRISSMWISSPGDRPDSSLTLRRNRDAAYAAQRCAIGEDDFTNTPQGTTVLDRLDIDGDLVTDLERILVIPGWIHDVRRLRLGDPTDGRAVLTLHIDGQQAMGIGVDPLHDRALEHHHLAVVVGRAAMVRGEGRRHEHTHRHGDDKAPSHCASSLFLVLEPHIPPDYRRQGRGERQLARVWEEHSWAWQKRNLSGSTGSGTIASSRVC